MAEILVSGFCEDRPPLLTAGFFLAAMLSACSLQWTPPEKYDGFPNASFGAGAVARQLQGVARIERPAFARCGRMHTPGCPLVFYKLRPCFRASGLSLAIARPCLVIGAHFPL